MKSKRGRKGPSAAAIASSKGGKATATAAVALDTSLWEQLLTGGGAATTASVAAKHSKLPAPKPGSAPRPDKLSTKKKKQVPAVGNFAKSVTNNWNMLLAGGGSATAGAAAAATAVPDNGHASSGKNRGKKAKKGGKRPRSEIGQGSRTSSGAATTTPDFFSAKRPGNGVTGVTSNSGKKRKRAVVGGGAGPPDAAAGGSTGSASLAGTGGKHRKEQKRSVDVGDGSKRPRSNALNLAFQAQKEQAAAAAAAAEGAGAAGVAGAHKGGNKGRGKGRAGGKGGSEKPLTAAEKAQYVALDCEMVGVGPGGCRSALARCCLVDWDGNTIYDKHVTPNERVTDFRTFVSGVKANHLKGGLRLRQCQEEVAAILKGKILVGHALHNDLKALMMSHPQRATRDTATYRPYQKAHGKAGGKLRPRSLKLLAQDHLDRSIQSGQHSPAEDAKAAMDLYRLARFEWEKSLSAAGKMRGRKAIVDQQG